MAPSRRSLGRDLCVHIFAVSGAMVGVCLTVIGIVQVVIAATKMDTWADELLAVDAGLFLIACLFAYAGLRNPSVHRREWLKRSADLAFVLGLLLMALVCALLTYVIAFP